MASKKYIVFLLGLCMLLTACSQPKQVKYAMVDLPKVVSVHPLYPEYSQVQENIKKMEYTRAGQVAVAQGHMSRLNKLVGRDSADRNKFEMALVQSKLSEVDAAAHVKFLKKRSDLIGEVQEKFRSQEQAIYEKHKLSIFNARNKLQVLRLDEKRRAELTEELRVAEKKQNEELRALNELKVQAIKTDLQAYEEQLKKEMLKDTEGVRKLLLEESGLRNEDMDKKMEELSKQLQDTVLNLDKEIANLQNRREIIYNKIYADIEEKTAIIAKQKGYDAVFTNVRVNLKADDLTELLKEKIKK